MIEGQIRASWEISRKPPPNLRILLCLRLSSLRLVWIPPVCCIQILMHISPLTHETSSSWQYKWTVKIVCLFTFANVVPKQKISVTPVDKDWLCIFYGCNGCLLWTWLQYLFIYGPACLHFGSSEVIWLGLCCPQYVGRWMIALRDCVFRRRTQQQVSDCWLTQRRVCAQGAVATACRWPDESV